MKFMEAVETAFTAIFSLIFLMLFVMIAPLSILMDKLLAWRKGIRRSK